MKSVCTVLAFCIFIAALTPPADANYPRGGAGVAGKILSVSDRYFIFDTNKGPVKVFISANTNFEVHGKHADASAVKEGVAARVTGHVLTPGVWESWKVNITEK